MLKLGTNPYLLITVGVPTVLGALVCGGIQRTLRHRTALYLVGFVIWMALAVPTSSWRGGSIVLLTSYLKTEFSMLFVLAGLAVSWKECKSIMAMIAAASIVNIFTSQLFGMDGDRFAMSFGTLSGSNDFAAHLLFVLFFLLFFVINPKTIKLVRIVATGCLVYGFLLVAETGSRGGSLALIITLGLFLLLASWRQRLALLALIPIGLIGITANMNQKALERIGSLYSGKVVDDGTSSSSTARWYLFQKSLTFTMQHPLFGVGPGEFGDFEGESMRDEGKRGLWMQTHNTLTQVSSESGIVALLFYFACLAGSFRLLLKSYKITRQRNEREMSAAVLCTILAFTAYTTASMFLSMAYSFYTPILCGFCIILSEAVSRECKTVSVATRAPAWTIKPIPSSSAPHTPMPPRSPVRQPRPRLSSALRMRN